MLRVSKNKVPKVKKNFLLFFILLLNGLQAQSLSLSTCITKALNAQPDIKKSLLQIQHSKQGINIAKADYRPQVSLSAEYNPTKTYVLPSNGMFNTLEGDGWQAGVTAKRLIWDFDKTSSNIDAKVLQVDIANLSLQDAKALLAYKVKLQYELMVVQREAITVRRKDLETKKELYKQAQALRKQGLKTKADETRFLSSLYIAKDNLALSQSNFEKAKMLLSLYINEPIETNVKLENSILKSTWKGKDLAHVLENSPTLSSLEVSINQKELELKSAKASHYGSVDAVASYTYQSSLNEYESSYIGITFNMPLYTGGRMSALEEQAKINKQNSQFEHDSKSLALEEEVQNLLIDLKYYAQSIKTKEIQLQANEETKEVTESRYKGGLSTYIELLDAIGLTQESELGILEAQYKKSSAIHRLEYLEGKTLEGNKNENH
jgi:outer membrane protein TolC